MIKDMTWKDGKTAPKDGTKFLAWDCCGYEICEWVVDNRVTYEEQHNGLFKKVIKESGYWNNNTPILWTELPAPPETPIT